MQRYIRELTLWQRIQLTWASLRTRRTKEDLMQEIISNSLEARKRGPENFKAKE